MMDTTSMSRVWREPARLIVVLGILLCPSTALALDVPPLTGQVVDLAQVLSASEVDQLTKELKSHEEKTTNQVALLILPSLEGEPLEQFSHLVATAWKLGQKGTDNGALLLVALKERKIRIEVGYGLEGTLTDLRSAHIVRHEIVPRFRAGDIPGGVRAGTEAILKTIEGTYQAPERASPGLESDVMGQVVIAVVVGMFVGLGLMSVNRLFGALVGTGLSVLLAPWLIPALITGGITLVLLSLIGAAGSTGRGGGRRMGDDWTWYSSRGGGWSGSSFDTGGGGFSGGGGDFGGGGASGDW